MDEANPVAQVPGAAVVAQVSAIYSSMVAVHGELAKAGISKDRRNEQQNFRFRGIDDVMNAVSPLLPKHGVLLLVDYEDYPDVERVTKSGGSLIYTKVRGHFTFVSAKDGSQVQVATFGVAMDSGDKSTNKAMSAALKYALLQTFLIPTESNEDADATTPEPTVVKSPVGFDEWFAELLAIAAHEGIDAMRTAWRTSSKEFRTYALEYRKADWDEAKELATNVTKQRQSAEAGTVA